MPNKDRSPFLTNNERVRSFLGWAFVASLLAHLFLGPLIPFKEAHSEDQQTEKVSVTKKIKVKVPTPPPPTPTPKPTQQPKTTPPPKKQEQHPQPKLKVEPPKTHSNGGAGPSEAKYNVKSGSQAGVPQGNGTPAPGPAGTVGPPARPPTPPPPKCGTPFKDATLVSASQPEYPESAKEAGLGPVVVIVRIDLSASASVLSASVLQSSGNSAIDQAALRAARQSSYSAKVENCTPVQGSYSFRANFDPSS